MNPKEVRLLHLIKSLEIGGIEKSAILLSNHLAEKIGFTGILAAPGLYSHNNIVSAKVHLFTLKEKPEGFWSLLKNLPCLLKVIRSNSVNVIMYHHRIFLPLVILIRLLKPDIKIIYKAHNVFNDRINKFLVADIIIAVSERVKEDLNDRKNIIVIIHGIELPVKNIRNKSHRIKSIGYAGRFHKSKSLDLLISAFNKLCNNQPQILLKLIGEGTEENRLKKLAKESQCPGRISFYPPHWDEDVIYEKIDLLVLPSSELEGFGLVLAEAMSRRIPVIVSDFVSSIGFVKDNITGLIFKNGDITDLTEKIAKIISDSELRSKLILNAELYIKKFYTIDKTVNSHLRLLQSF
ncbi:MAG: glycosyltransferase family 4 protein [Ignavibacteriaceae bacterium]